MDLRSHLDLRDDLLGRAAAHLRSKRSRFITCGHVPGRSFLSGSERLLTLTTLTMPFDITKYYILTAQLCDLGPRGDEVVDEDCFRVVARVVLSERAELRRARGRA